MPITTLVAAVIAREVTLRQATETLLSRPLKPEYPCASP